MTLANRCSGPPFPILLGRDVAASKPGLWPQQPNRHVTVSSAHATLTETERVMQPSLASSVAILCMLKRSASSKRAASVQVSRV